MEIRIQSIHFDADVKLIQFAERKIEKLDQYYDRILHVDLYLKFDSANSTIKEKTAEIKLHLPGTTLFSSESDKTFEAAIDRAVASVKRQLTKHKEKLKN